MKLLYPLTTDERPVLGEVGGKAASLMCMIQRDFPVPPGFVLALAFFEPWLEHICRTPEWASVLNSSPEEMAQRCEAVKALGLDLEMDPAREGMLAQALEPLTVGNSFPLLAVRSSSPEEDLEDLSFAGGYETTLGVTPGRLKEAIRRSFASCLDARVLVYKQQHGLSIHRPRIAVIVQQQVAAETAGVAFSLNPINNCYDEAVINANFGLGESVVSGQVSPDSFVVDKVSRAILRRKLGKKETSTWLQPDGSLALKPSPSRAALCLSDAQVLELAEMLVGVEDAYERPVDIEWAFAAGRPYLLQARPITAYVPLPEDMQTRPGEPRVLYIDYTLAKQGIDFPLSTMGADCWERVQRSTLGADGLFGLENGLMFTRGGRFYANLSRYLKLQSKESTASQIRLQDTLSADTIRNLDDVYKADSLPGSLQAALVRMALARIATVVGAFRALSRPQQRHQVLLEESQRLERDLAAEQAKEQSIGALARATIRRVADYQNKVSLPATVAAELARSRINRLLSGEEPGVRAKVIYLQRGLPNNVTVEMGLAMYELASFDEVRACPSAAEFTRRIDQRTFSAEFLRAWDVFTETYGHRSAVDLDMAAPRFREVPGEVYRQLQTMAVGIDTERVEDARNSLAVYERGIVERTQAYEFLLEIVRRRSKRQAKRFAKYYSVLVTFEGYREIHKYYIVWVVDILRQKALAVGQSLVQAGRLDSVVQVFDLTIEELDRGQADPSLDLRALANENTRFLSKSRHVRHYPRIIDSRGKIVLPPRKEAKAGELLGEPISPGTVRGKVKVLAMPDEKPVLPGEILVTRATDPGWTPLFLNAAGIILEVGGVLQHGAVVAREYGKPCVIGIQDAATILRDGQVVELDGANGIVRLV